MKTLKQLLKENCLNKTDNCIRTHTINCEDCEIEAVKEWLTQKRQEKQNMRWGDTKEDYFGAQVKFANELLEELQQ